MLNKQQTQIILGSLLGDASISRMRKSYIFSITHGHKQYKYVKFISEKLGVKLYKCSASKSFSRHKYKWKISYCNKQVLHNIFNIVKNKEIKTINNRWLNLITPEGIAYWFMDDGSSTYARDTSILVRFSTYSYSLQEIEKLQGLLYKYGVLTSMSHTDRGKGVVLSIRQISVNKFMDLISPYVHSSMKYKLKYRNKPVTRKLRTDLWTSIK